MPDGLQVRPLTGVIGAEVQGLDLGVPLEPGTVAAVRRALLDHLVLFFRDQDLSEAEQLAFSAQFGEPVLPMGGTPDPGAGPTQFFNVLEDGPDSVPKADFWHTDVAFLAAPPDIAVLSMQDAPDLGGDTSWLSLYALYDALSPTLQALVDPLELDLDLGEPFRLAVTSMQGEEAYRRMAAAVPVMRHPLVRIHPETGRRALFLCGAFMRSVAGLHPDESSALLDLLRSKLADPNLAVRWQWRRHDVAMWDERCTNHRANGDHYPAHRLVRRCMVGSSVPVGPFGEGGHPAPLEGAVPAAG